MNFLSGSDAPAEVSYVDWASLERTLRKTDSQIQFLRNFMDNYVNAPATLRALLQSQDSDGLHRLVHRINGATAFLCATQTQQQAKDIEVQMVYAEVLPDAQIYALADNLAHVLHEVAARLRPMRLIESPLAHDHRLS